MASLCQHCKVLIINEQKVGGREVNLDGQTVFEFDNNNIDLEYDRRDSYPGFPVLDSSAAAGCGFCGLLKQAIKVRYEKTFQERFKEIQKPIEFIIHKLQYHRVRFQVSPVDGRLDRLFLLVARITAVSDLDASWCRELVIPFELYADEGIAHIASLLQIKC